MLLPEVGFLPLPLLLVSPLLLSFLSFPRVLRLSLPPPPWLLPPLLLCVSRISPVLALPTVLSSLSRLPLLALLLWVLLPFPLSAFLEFSLLAPPAPLLRCPRFGCPLDLREC